MPLSPELRAGPALSVDPEQKWTWVPKCVVGGTRRNCAHQGEKLRALGADSTKILGSSLFLNANNVPIGLRLSDCRKELGSTLGAWDWALGSVCRKYITKWRLL